MRVNFKSPKKLNKHEKKQKRIAKALSQRGPKDDPSNSEMKRDTSTLQELKDRGLSVAARKQIFKKHKSKDCKAQIVELRILSKKLNKKDLKQKAEKGKIAKQIKELKSRIKQSGEEKGDESSDDDSE